MEHHSDSTNGEIPDPGVPKCTKDGFEVARHPSLIAEVRSACQSWVTAGRDTMRIGPKTESGLRTRETLPGARCSGRRTNECVTGHRP